MDMTVLYFTATGNSLFVAKKIGGELLSIPKLVREGRYEIKDDVVGLVCPTYCADVPRMVREYLAKATIEADYTFFIGTYGYMAGAYTDHAAEFLKKAAGHADYVDKIIMVDTALTRFESQKQIDTLPEKHVDQQMERILSNISSRRHSTPRVGAGDKFVDWLYHTAGASQVAPEKAKSHIVNDQCVHCGTCARVCPADNIIVTKEKVEFLDHCEGCLGCVHNCPKNAIHLKNEKSNARFRNPEVSIRDLVEANN